MWVEAVCQYLMDLANSRRGRDDIKVVVIHMEASEHSEEERPCDFSQKVGGSLGARQVA